MNSRLRWRSLNRGWTFPMRRIDPGQQAERAMAFALMITREGRVDAGHRRQIGRRRCDGLDSRFFVIRDDRYRLARFLGLGDLFQDLHLAITAQNFRHPLLELGVTTFQIVSHLVRLDFTLGRESCTSYPAPGRRDIRARQPVRSCVHGAPAAASSTTRSDSRAPWALSRARDTNQALAFGVIVGSLLGRGRSSSAARGP